MADGSQQPVQIMETQTGFDLIASIAKWRQELTAQAGLTLDDRRELETHLQDSVADLRHLGLNDEEVFWLARRRVGVPQQLSEEFVKENPARVWRERLLWIALALLGLQLWEAACFSLGSPFVLVSWTMRSVPEWLAALRDMWHAPFGNEFIYIVTAIWFAVQVRRGRMNRLISSWEFLSQSRLRFLSATIPLVLVVVALEIIGRLPFWEFMLNPVHRDLLHSRYVADFTYSFLLSVSSPLALVFFIAWLIPERRNTTDQLAETARQFWIGRQRSGTTEAGPPPRWPFSGSGVFS